MPLHDLAPGDPTQVGPYRVQARLGAGGMGVVLFGFDARGEPVALKMLTAVANPDARSVRR